MNVEKSMRKGVGHLDVDDGNNFISLNTVEMPDGETRLRLVSGGFISPAMADTLLEWLQAWKEYGDTLQDPEWEDG